LVKLYQQPYDADKPDGIADCDLRHVDGTLNALVRQNALDWLKADMDASECRILLNAHCLSEGIDVPALDAVVFFDTRKSVVDIVQSVGRVMRKAEGKQYGYIILPVWVVVKFKVTWLCDLTIRPPLLFPSLATGFRQSLPE